MSITNHFAESILFNCPFKHEPRFIDSFHTLLYLQHPKSSSKIQHKAHRIARIQCFIAKHCLHHSRDQHYESPDWIDSESTCVRFDSFDSHCQSYNLYQQSKSHWMFIILIVYKISITTEICLLKYVNFHSLSTIKNIGDHTTVTYRLIHIQCFIGTALWLILVRNAGAV